MELNGFLVGVLCVERAVEVARLGQLIKIFVFVLSHLLLNLLGPLKLSRFERVCSFGQHLHDLVVVKSQLDVRNGVHAILSILILVVPHEPLFDLLSEFLLEDDHCILLRNALLLDSLHKSVPVTLRNLALDRVVAQRDQVAVVDLVVDHVCRLVDHECVAIGQADIKANDRGAKPHHFLQKEHLGVLLACNLQKDELLVILFRRG